MHTHSFLADQVPELTDGRIQVVPVPSDISELSLTNVISYFGHCQRPKLNEFNSVLAWKGTCRSVILGRREYDQSASTLKRARRIAHHPSASKV
jgi:hypothetical protein